MIYHIPTNININVFREHIPFHPFPTFWVGIPTSPQCSTSARQMQYNKMIFLLITPSNAKAIITENQNQSRMIRIRNKYNNKLQAKKK